MSPFDTLREQLLQAGVASRHVRRYITELREHSDDLIALFVSEGFAWDEAQRQALARLGHMEDLADAMLARPELRTWTARAPWATLLVGPALLLAASVAASAWLAHGMIQQFGMGALGHPLLPSWFIGVASALGGYLTLVLPILYGWGIVVLATRRRVCSSWPVAGLIAMAFLGAAAHFQIVVPLTSGGPGAINVGITAPDLLRVAWILLATLIPWTVWCHGQEELSF